MWAGIALTAAAGAANAQTTLRISSWAPPTHHINAKMWPWWGKCIAAATDGRVKTKVLYKLASPLRQFDLVRTGVADASWIFHGYNPGKFLATQVVEIPLLGNQRRSGLGRLLARLPEISPERS